ncbi:IS3 family transposase [Amycolatopsis ultiminotia]|uniref:IS3 family transposase n=1 Tax=Amycolatopsis ultiminotia TaxID=543629 RepID=A0ABP6UUJ9_9PSEU
MAKYAGPDEFTGAAGVASPPCTRFSVRRRARLLGVSASGYYAHVKRAAATVLTPRQQRRADLEVKIARVHQEPGGTYGSPRISAELRDQGEVVTAKTIAKIMASIGLEGISPRSFTVKTTVVDPGASFPTDLVGRHFDQGRPDAVWLTGITYLTCGEGDMFVCAVRDGCTRKVLGYSISDHISAEMVTDAIDAAVAARGGRCRGTTLDSDRGGERTARLTATTCFRHGLRRLMGATGICWDNSPAESFWPTFKHERYYRRAYATKTERVAAVDKLDLLLQ